MTRRDSSDSIASFRTFLFLLLAIHSLAWKSQSTASLDDTLQERFPYIASQFSTFLVA